MNPNLQSLIEEALSLISETSAKTKEGRKIIKQLIRIIDLAENANEDMSDIESDLGFIRQQYSGYPPFPLDDVDYDEDDTE